MPQLLDRHATPPEHLPAASSSSLELPEPELAREAVRKLGGLEPASRGEYEDLARIARSGGAAIVPDVVEVLEETRDLEALGRLEVLAADLGASHFVQIRERMLDPGRPELYRASLARVVAHLEEVAEAVRAQALERMMGDPDPGARASATEAAGVSSIRDDRLASRLRELAQQDPDGWVRECAQEALEELGL